jgi:hypothetical protein
MKIGIWYTHVDIRILSINWRCMHVCTEFAFFLVFLLLLGKCASVSKVISGLNYNMYATNETKQTNING